MLAQAECAFGRFAASFLEITSADQMAALHRAVISILDVCLHFGEFFVAFAGDTTLDISRNSISLRRHRSRRQRRQLRNVIGFSQSIIDSHSSSEDDTDDGGDEAALRVEPSFSMVTSTDEAPSDRLDKMSTELDSLIRFIRRGVETLAGGTGEAAPAFGVLAFALEDWDR
jgi:gamma-tubulin complex component 5